MTSKISQHLTLLMMNISSSGLYNQLPVQIDFARIGLSHIPHKREVIEEARRYILQLRKQIEKAEASEASQKDPLWKRQNLQIYPSKNSRNLYDAK